MNWKAAVHAVGLAGLAGLDPAHELVEVLDLAQTHCIPIEAMRQGEFFEHLRELKRQGKIKAFADRKKALKGADYVINTIQVGLYEPCTGPSGIRLVVRDSASFPGGAVAAVEDRSVISPTDLFVHFR